MRLHYAALVIILLTALGVSAQDLSVTPPDPTVIICPGPDVRCPPLPAAGIPTTKKGVFDSLVKAMPGVVSVIVPLVFVFVKIGAPHLVSKIPGKYLPVVSAAVSALGAALAATGANTVLDGAGGVRWEVAALEAGPAAGAVHYGLNQVAKRAEDKQADVEKKG